MRLVHGSPPPNVAVAFDVSANALYGRVVPANLFFISADHVPRGTMAAIGSQAITVAIKLNLFPVKLLFILAKVAS